MAAVMAGREKTDWTEIKRVVRQGVCCRQTCFSVNDQGAVEEVNDMDGISIGARNVNNIRYADDSVLLADPEEKLHELATVLQESCEGKGSKINARKIETMVITKKKTTN